jgi:uncharacterized protein YegP (UPF0339 family)
MATFVILKKNSNDYKFEFVSRKGKTIVSSNDFALRFECEEKITVLKSTVEICDYLKFKTSKGKCFFKIMLEDELVAISRKYTTALLMQKGIEEFKKYASKSEVLDFSATENIFLDL